MKSFALVSIFYIKIDANPQRRGRNKDVVGNVFFYMLAY